MSSKEGTHTPVSDRSLDIEPGTLVSYRTPGAWGEGLVIETHPVFSTGRLSRAQSTAQVMWCGTDSVSTIRFMDLFPCTQATN